MMCTKEDGHAAITVARGTIRDPVEIAALMGEATELLPARPADYRLESEVVVTPLITVHWMSHRGDAVIEETNVDSQVFALLGDRYVDSSVGGVDVTAGAITATDPGPHLVRLRGRNDYVLMEVPDDWEVTTPDGAVRNLRPTPAAYARLAGLLARMRCVARTNPKGASSLMALAESVSDGLYGVVAEAAAFGPMHDADEANRIVRESIAAIRAQRADSIVQLTREVAASRSSIYRSFDAVVGMSPYGYMQHRRLVKLRRRLLEVDAEPGAVTREAARLGAFHLGNLAKSYRQLFGELPSETVSRTVDPGVDEGLVWHDLD